MSEPSVGEPGRMTDLSLYPLFPLVLLGAIILPPAEMVGVQASRPQRVRKSRPLPLPATVLFVLLFLPLPALSASGG